MGVEVANELPYNDYFEYFGPDFKLHVSPSNMTNLNTTDYLEKVKTRLFENLRMLPHAPGVQVHAIPEDGINMEVEEAEIDNDADDNKDVRMTKSEKDKRIMADNEYSDSEDEGPHGDGRKNNESHKTKKPKVDENKVNIATEDTNGNKGEKKDIVDEKKTEKEEEPMVEEIEQKEEDKSSDDVEMKEVNGTEPTSASAAQEKKEENENDSVVVET